jgi:predicted phosphoribosyltransferase
MGAAADAWLAEAVEAARRSVVVAAVTPDSRALAAALAARLGLPSAHVLACGLTGDEDDHVCWGAMDEEGSYVVDYFAVAGMRLDEAELRAARERAQPRIEAVRTKCPEAPLTDFLPAERVVLVQAGLDQGLLMDAAVSLALRHGADEVVVASPWSTTRAAARFAERERVVFTCARLLATPPEATARRAAASRLAGW